MTTAARPTFDPAKGGRERGDLSTLSKQYSSRDLPGHTKLKYRQEGQGAPEEVTSSKDYKRALDEKEQASAARSRKRTRPEVLDADDPVDSDPENEDGDSDDDDEAELLAELARIKKERAEEMQQKEQEKKIENERIRTENILTGNPLLQRSEATASDFSVKRRWDDDVIFKNCAKDEEDKKSKGFVNDTLRSEFHKKFLSKYIK